MHPKWNVSRTKQTFHLLRFSMKYSKISVFNSAKFFPLIYSLYFLHALSSTFLPISFVQRLLSLELSKRSDLTPPKTVLTHHKIIRRCVDKTHTQNKSQIDTENLLGVTRGEGEWWAARRVKGVWAVWWWMVTDFRGDALL